MKIRRIRIARLPVSTVSRYIVLGFLCVCFMFYLYDLKKARDEVRKDKLWAQTENVDDKVLLAVNAPALMQSMSSPRARFKFIMEPNIHVMKNSDHTGWISIAMVKSYIGNSDRREAIRETWGKLRKFKDSLFLTVFIVARSDNKKLTGIVAKENKVHGDVLLVDMLDTAENVPEKTLAGMQWVADNVPPDWIYSSADDDLVFHIVNFAKYIDEAKSAGQVIPECAQNISSRPIMCVYSYDKNDPPARSPLSKWYMPKSTYPESYWPPYCRGGWYSMEVKLAGSLYEISRWVPFLRLDDVWITGLMRIKLLAKTCERRKVFEGLLHAAPLSSRNDRQLENNVGESSDIVLVSHVWGNIENINVDVPKVLRNKWRSWSPNVEKIIL